MVPGPCLVYRHHDTQQIFIYSTTSSPELPSSKVDEEFCIQRCRERERERAERYGMIVGSIVNHFLFWELPGKSSFISDHQLYAETQWWSQHSIQLLSSLAAWLPDKQSLENTSLFSPRSCRPTVAKLSIIKDKDELSPPVSQSLSVSVSVGFKWILHARAGPSHDSASSPGWCPTSSSASIFLFPGLIFIQNFCQFIMVGNPPSSLPTTTCLWFQGLTVFVIDIKLKENTNPCPTDHQVRLRRNTKPWAKV